MGIFSSQRRGLYLRMYAGCKAPSLLPKYSTDYVVHKEVVRHLCIDGIGIFLFDSKKSIYPPIPFYIGIYKFSKVKSALDFVKDLENFHFGENSFHRNDAQGKVVSHCALVKLNFEYSDHFDKYEEVYHNACNMNALNKCFKRKIIVSGGKGSSNTTTEYKRQEKEFAQ